MNRVSTKSLILLAIVLLLGTMAYAENQPWPLKRTIDLSSGFGDFRANRFHAGVDLRTGGAVGAGVYSPVDGYIWRVKMSYRGYGRGLYIKGDDNYFYVLAHLDRFVDPLQSTIHREQFARERYYVDITFPKDSIRVKQGQLVAYSGKTGIGAPHLHFEKRTPDNVPIDPLTHGFSLDDKTPPSFERIGFHLLDDRSLFSNGRRKIFLPVRKVSATEYVLDTVLYLNATFGVLADCYDQMREGGMRQAVKKLKLQFDGKLYYESSLDSLPFEIGPVVNLAYDPNEAAGGEKRVRRFYHLYEPFSEFQPVLDYRGGHISGNVLSDTLLHMLTVIAEDSRGNESKLRVKFRWGEAGVVAENVLTGYEATEKGVIYREVDTTTSAMTSTFFSFGDEFRPPNQISGYITNLPVPQDFTRELSTGVLKNGMIWPAFHDLSITAGDNSLFWPFVIAVEHVRSNGEDDTNLASNRYLISPDGMAVRKPLQFSIKLDPSVSTNPHTGLCWYNKLEKEWVWIDDETDNDDLAAGPSLGGGLFAAIIDTTAPIIHGLNLKRGHRYWNSRLRVKFKLDDNLSGFKDDRSLNVRIDGNWLLPEFDIEDGDVVATLRKPLALGKHLLSISVLDRAGNSATKKIEFEVIRKNN